MVSALSGKSGVPEPRLYEEFKEVYARHGSLEYLLAIQELPSLQRRGQDEVNELVLAGRNAFRQTRERNLLPYPGVLETLSTLQRGGYAIIGVTNTPVYLGLRRLNLLGLDSLFDGLAGWRGVKYVGGNRSARDLIPAYINELTRSSCLIRQGKSIWKLSDQNVKPSTYAYKAVVQSMCEKSDNVWVIGDSLSKDLVPAQDLGLHTVWAKYGHHVDERSLSTLLAITHWSPLSIDQAYSTVALEPEHVAGSFADLLSIMPSEAR
jgi:FMN phosphatase YigB (HAD superfamily)